LSENGGKGRLLGSNPQRVLVFLVGLSLEKEDNIRWVFAAFFVHVEDCLKAQMAIMELYSTIHN